jgi:hypothetical protein
VNKIIDIDSPAIARKEYLVFPCEKCGKWTYAKIDQKARKCGICKTNHIIAEIRVFELADGVSNAAKIAQNKNFQWQSEKGIQINIPKRSEKISHKSPKNHPLKSIEPGLEQSDTVKYAPIMQKIKQNIINTHLPQPIPVGFLSVLYEMIAGNTPSFARFLRYGLNSKQIEGDSFFGYIIK